MIKILKASAGSGKTYTLAREYISILLGSMDRYAYRHILAVTFTNKATAEMKSRILKELHVLATDPESSGYFNDFVPDPCRDAATLRSRAKRVLVDILHDYGSFYVSTIDKFFQMTLKAFSREVGQFASYQIELDRNSLVHESVDRILDGITEDSTELIGRLNEGVMAQLRQGKRVNLERGLYDMAEKLKNEERRERSEMLGIDPAVAFSEENLAAVRAECDRVIDAFTAALGTAARAVLAVLDQAGVPPSETSRGFLSKVEDYATVVPGRAVARPTDTFMRNAADSSLWFAKAKAKRYLPLVQGALEGPLEAFCALFDTPLKMYNTAVLLKEQAFTPFSAISSTGATPPSSTKRWVCVSRISCWTSSRTPPTSSGRISCLCCARATLPAGPTSWSATSSRASTAGAAPTGACWPTASRRSSAEPR